MKLDGNRNLQIQGNYGKAASGVNVNPSYVKSNVAPILQAAAEQLTERNAIEYAIDQQAEQTAITSGVSKGAVEYAMKVKELEKADPDVAMQMFDEWEAGFNEKLRLDYKNPNVRDSIQQSLVRTAGQHRIKMLSNTATNMSLKDDAVVTELGDVFFGQAIDGINNSNPYTAGLSITTYLNQLENEMWPEFEKRKQKYTSPEIAESAFNSYASGKLTELAEVLIDRDESIWDESIEAILGSDYIKKYSENPSAIINSHKQGKIGRVSKDADAYKRNITANMQGRLNSPVESPNFLANWDETVDNHIKAVEQNPNLDYSSNALVVANQSTNYVLGNANLFGSLKDARNTLDTMLSHPSFAGLTNIDSASLRAEVEEGFRLRTQGVVESVNSAIKDHIANPGVELTEDIVNQILATSDASQVIPVVKQESGQYKQLEQADYLALLLEDSLVLASTHTTGAADKSEFDVLNAILTKSGATSSRIETARKTGVVEPGTITDEQYVQSVINGENTDLIANQTILNRAFKGMPAEDARNTAIGLFAAGTDTDYLRTYEDELLEKDPSEFIAHHRKLHTENQLSYNRQRTDQFDKRVDGLHTFEDIVAAGVQTGSTVLDTISTIAENDPSQVAPLVDKFNTLGLLIGNKLSEQQQDQIGDTTDIRENIKRGMRIPLNKVEVEFGFPTAAMMQIFKGEFGDKESLRSDTIERAAMTVSALLTVKQLDGEEAFKYMKTSQFVTDLREMDKNNGVVITSADELGIENSRVPNSALNRTEQTWTVLGEKSEPIFNIYQREAVANLDANAIPELYQTQIGSRSGTGDYMNAFAISSSEAKGFSKLDQGYDYLIVPITDSINTSTVLGYQINTIRADGNIGKIDNNVIVNGILSLDLNRRENQEGVMEMLANMHLHMATYAPNKFYDPNPEIRPDEEMTLINEAYRLQ